MTYPGQFHRLVMIGTLYGDNFNMTLNIVPSALGELGMPAVDDATLAGVASDVGTWFPKTTGSGGVSFISGAKLTSIKLNRINSAGHYVDETKEHVYPTPIAGSLNTAFPAPQLATVVTLRTAVPRGRGSKGRIFLVPNISMSPLGPDGRITEGVAPVIMAGVANLIIALNARYTLVGRVGVASNAGTGRFEHVTSLAMGRVVDTMRSRRNKLDEAYEDFPV